MDKQNINIEKLYKERFQHFEVEPSSDSLLAMQQQLRYAKKVKFIKWLIGSGFVVTAVIGITFLSFYKGWLPGFSPDYDVDMAVSQAVGIDTLMSNKSLLPDVVEYDNVDQQINAKLVEGENTKSEVSSEVSVHDPKISFVEEKTIQPQHDRYESANSDASTHFMDFALPEVEQKTNRLLTISRVEPRRMSLEYSDKLYSSTPLRASNFIPNKTFNKNFFKPSFNNGIWDQYYLFGQWNAFFNVYWSPFFWRNSAKTVDPNLDENYSYALNNIPLSSHELGASFELKHQDYPLVIQLGMDYQRVREMVKYNILHTYEDVAQSYWKYDSTIDLNRVLDTSYIIVEYDHFAFDSVFVQDTTVFVDSTYVPVMVSDKKIKDNVNTYRYLTVPLLLGYQFGSQNDKWNFQMLGGAAIGINLSNKGWYYTKSGVYRRYDGTMTPSISWNLSAAANVSYKWKQWIFFAQPEFLYQLSESVLDRQVPRRKYQFYKLKIGVKFRLF